MSSKVVEANAKIHSLAMAVAVSFIFCDRSVLACLRWIGICCFGFVSGLSGVRWLGYGIETF